MKKISFKIMLAITLCSIATAILLSGVSINRNTRTLENELEKTLTFASEKYANQFSAIFENTEGMVDAVAANVAVTFQTEEFYSDEGYVLDYKAYLDSIIKETITSGETVHGLYFTFNPELLEEEQEVWYAYDRNGKLVSIEADFGANKRDFSEPIRKDMLYYFKPIFTQKGSWTGPYMDPDVSLNMLSYSKAVYVNGVLIGVAGADILTEDTIDIVDTMKIYDDSYAFLLDENYQYIIRPKNNSIGILANGEQADSQFMQAHMAKQTTGVVRIKDIRQGSILAFSHLSNGWILGIIQSTDEVYSAIRVFSIFLAGLAIITIASTIIFAVVFSNRFSRPILSAADQLKLLEIGDYTHNIPQELLNRKDDLGEFSKAISAIQETLKQEAKDIREKDVLLLYQSRQAKIGEMVGNISHQWKQPLNSMNLILLNLYDAYTYQELDDGIFKETVDKMRKIIRTMSTTIEDFTDFLKPNRDKVQFEVSNSIQLALSLLEASIKYHEIMISIEVEPDLILYGFPNEFSHVLFNVLGNARDAVVEAEDQPKQIFIRGYREGSSVIVEIENKGKPIPESLLINVFDPYVTTKGEKEGTGIGLYISKLIIEQSMGGRIQLENVEDGVCCRIMIYTCV